METAVALVSCLVWRERGEGGAAVRPELQGPLAALREAARRIGKVPDSLLAIQAILAQYSCGGLCMRLPCASSLFTGHV